MENTQTANNPLIRKWIHFLNIGVKEDFPYKLRNRIRILNGISGVAILVFLVYGIVCIQPTLDNNADFKYGLLLSTGVIFFHAFFIFLNKVKMNTLAAHLFIWVNVSLYALLFLTQPKLNSIEYFLLPASALGMLFFTDIWLIIMYVLVTVGVFFTAKQLHGGIHPILIEHQVIPIYILNHLSVFVFIFSMVSYMKKQNLKQEEILEVQNKNLSDEKQKSDSLLLNILPEEIAEELKETGAAKAKSYSMVTVMFTDFKNFTSFTEKMNPEELVKSIDYYFSAFDNIVSKYDLEKIKTIGDSYMCAGGLPEESPDHALNVVKAAIEIQTFMDNFKKEQQAKGESWFELRLGIHSGPVVAGIVGIKKFAYDIWGDTVNVASLMESSGEVGKVNVSKETYELIKEHFTCTHRGKVKTKNKGDEDMYFVEPRKPNTN